MDGSGTAKNWGSHVKDIVCFKWSFFHVEAAYSKSLLKTYEHDTVTKLTPHQRAYLKKKKHIHSQYVPNKSGLSQRKSPAVDLHFSVLVVLVLSTALFGHTNLGCKSPYADPCHITHRAIGSMVYPPIHEWLIFRIAVKVNIPWILW